MSAWACFQNGGLPKGTDAELHVYRTAELGFSLAAGNLYPRWAPDFYYGLGYPIFNYYAPLTYYLGHLLTLGQPELAADRRQGVLYPRARHRRGRSLHARPPLWRRGWGAVGCASLCVCPIYPAHQPLRQGRSGRDLCTGVPAVGTVELGAGLEEGHRGQRGCCGDVDIRGLSEPQPDGAYLPGAGRGALAVALEIPTAPASGAGPRCRRYFRAHHGVLLAPFSIGALGSATQCCRRRTLRLPQSLRRAARSSGLGDAD